MLLKTRMRRIRPQARHSVCKKLFFFFAFKGGKKSPSLSVLLGLYAVTQKASTNVFLFFHFFFSGLIVIQSNRYLERIYFCSKNETLGVKM